MPYRRTPDRIEHTEAVRRRILSAARRIITAGGIEALKIRTVVTSAETSTGNYYFHFKDKKSLVIAIVEELAGLVAGSIDRAAHKAKDEPERLAAMVYTGVRSILSDRRLATVLFTGAHRDSVRSLVAEIFVKRTSSYFSTKDTPVLPVGGISTELLAHLWQGSILFTIERILDETLGCTDDEAASGCAKWNLSAIGTDPLIIEKSIDRARQTFQTESAAFG